METRTLRSHKFRDVLSLIQDSAPYHTRASVLDENPKYKRFGTYFVFDGNSARKEVEVVLENGGPRGESSSSSSSTPAEEIVKTYRARRAHIDEQVFLPDNGLPVKELQPRFRQSRYDALCDTVSGYAFILLYLSADIRIILGR